VVSDSALSVLGLRGLQEGCERAFIPLGARGLAHAKLALGKDVAGLLAGLRKLDYAYVAKLDALAVRAVGEDVGHPAVLGYPDAEALQGAVDVDYLLTRLGFEVRDGSVG
jgi:hypothetical protein